MKRLHVHVGVDDIDRSVRFYSTLVGAEPTVTKREEGPELGRLVSGNAAAEACCVPDLGHAEIKCCA
jgi:catechol 2,3-dioxygenase-like lactoylglutathione lyase family enzyme